MIKCKCKNWRRCCEGFWTPIWQPDCVYISNRRATIFYNKARLGAASMTSWYRDQSNYGFLPCMQISSIQFSAFDSGHWPKAAISYNKLLHADATISMETIKLAPVNLPDQSWCAGGPMSPGSTSSQSFFLPELLPVEVMNINRSWTKTFSGLNKYKRL